MSNSDIAAIQARSLWIGEIENWMDEAFIEKKLKNYNVTPKNVKVIRDRSKGISLGYGFIEFFSIEQANQVLIELNGKGLLEKNRTFKLNWAKDSASKAACMGSLPKNEYTIYVGELESNVNEEQLRSIFLKYYKSILGAKIVTDPINNNKSKGYGFVRFSDYNESLMAIQEMNGKIINGKVIKVNHASFKKFAEMGLTTNVNMGNEKTNTNTKTSPLVQLFHLENNTHDDMQSFEDTYLNNKNDTNTNNSLLHNYYRSNKIETEKETYESYIQPHAQQQKGRSNISITHSQYQHKSNEEYDNTIYTSHNQPQIYNQPSSNANYNLKENSTDINAHMPIEQKPNYDQMKKQIVASLNDFYKEQKPHPGINDEGKIKGQNYKEKEGSYNLLDFYNNHNRYPFINLFNYYFPNTPMNTYSKQE